MALRECYDCKQTWRFREDAPEDAIVLCGPDVEKRRLDRSFDGMGTELSNCSTSTELRLLGRPVVVSHTRVHESKQDGLVQLRTRSAR